MTFLEGFAQGFTAERTRRLDKQDKEDEIKLKYSLDDIAEQRKLRTAAALKDKELALSAKATATMMGKPEGAEQLANLMRTKGLTSDQLMKMYDSGQITLDDNWNATTTIAPKSPAIGESAGIKVPEAVSGTPAPTQDDLTSGYDQKTRDKVKSLLPSDQYMADPIPDYSGTDVANGPFKFSAPSKIGTLDQEENKLEILQNDPKSTPEAIAEQKRKVSLIRRNATQKIYDEAHASGKDVKTYITIDDNGRATGDAFPGYMDQDNQLWNKGSQKIVGGKFIELSDQAAQRYNQIVDQFSKDSDKYNSSLTSFASAVDSVSKYDKLLAEHGDVVNSLAGKAAVYSTKVLETVQGFGKLKDAYGFSSIEDAAQGFKEAGQKGDTSTAMTIMHDTETIVKELEDKINNQGVNDIAVYAQLGEALKTMSAMQLAQSLGFLSTSGSGTSNKDIERIFDQIGSGGNSESIRNNLATNIRSVNLRLMSEQKNLSESMKPKIDAFKLISGGLKIDLEPKRVEDHIRGINDENGYKYWKSATNGSYSATIVKPEEVQTPEVQLAPDQEVVPQAEAEQFLMENPTPENKEFFRKTYNVDPETILKRRK